jgi:NADPH-dependent methylglyoxal reductase
MPEITKVPHLASPFSYTTSKPKEDLIDVAVNGVHNLLNSVEKFNTRKMGHVDHVVVTSSFAAVLNLGRLNDTSLVFNEKDWNPLTVEEPLMGFLDIFVERKWKKKLHGITWKVTSKPLY